MALLQVALLCGRKDYVLRVLVFIITIHGIQSHKTRIDSSTDYLWTDDYSCGHDGWNECSIHYIQNEPYHGVYTGTDYDLSTTHHTYLIRDFECAISGVFTVQFWVGFDCKLEESTTDGIDFYFDDNYTPMAGCCDYSMADDGTLEDESLPSFEGQCNKNQPWLLQQSPLYAKVVNKDETILLKWDIITSHIEHEMILYDIEISCSNPTPSPTSAPTSNPSTSPTKDPTSDPTKDPTRDPTVDPTIDPTRDPSVDPTIDPTIDPTVDPTSDPTIDPTRDPTRDPTMDPTIDPTYDPTRDPTEAPTSDPSSDPTSDPTRDPTSDPTRDPSSDPTYRPTYEPTTEPTIHPTYEPTSDPTLNPVYIPIGTVDYEWITFNNTRFVHDAYSRFQVSVVMEFRYLKSLNQVHWYLIDYDSYERGDNWTEITMEEYKLVNIYTARIIDEYKLEELGFDVTDMIYSSVLSLKALRVLNSGYCYNSTLAPLHLLQPGKQYMFKVEIVADSAKNDAYDEYFESVYLHLSTNQFATNGICDLHLLSPKIKGKPKLLDNFYFDCYDWEDPDSIDANFTLKFNGMMNDVLINNELVSEFWTDDPQDIIGMIGTPALIIKVLIRDDLGAITCQNIDIADFFPAVDLSNEAILAAVRGVISETPLGQDNSVAIALNTVLEGLLAISYTNVDVLQEIMDMIVNNVLDTSFAINASETSPSRLISESTMVRALLQEHTLMYSGSSSLLIDTYLPSMMGAIDNEIVQQSEDTLDTSIGDPLSMIGMKTLELSGKLEAYMSEDKDDIDLDHNSVMESFVEIAAYSGYVALSQSYPGDTFEYEDHDGERTVITSKIDPNATDKGEYQKCGTAHNSIMIPNTVADTFFDCSFVDQKSVAFEAGNKPERATKDAKRTLSNTVTINFYRGDISNSVFDTRERRRRRRRRLFVNEIAEVAQLAASHLESTDVKNRCNPFWIKIDLSQNGDGLYTDAGKQNKYSLSGDTPYPSCTFWNVTEKQWDTNNCFVYNYTSEYVLCACTHLTTFNIKADDFQPKANMITIYHFRDLTADNLIKYPVVWISLIVITVIFVSICSLFPAQHKDNKSPLAYQDIIFRPIRDIKTQYFLPSTTTHVFNDIYGEKHQQYGMGLIKTIRANICVLQLRLYKIYLYDMHTLLSVFQHSEGTNYSKRERLGSFFLYLCTIMVSSAAFYGVEQQRFGDITASFLISLWSTIPAFIAKKSFMKAKPKITPFKLIMNDVDYEEIEKKVIELSELRVPETDIARYDDDRYSVKISGFKKPLLKKTVKEEVSKYGKPTAFRMHNSRTHCYVIYKTEKEAKRCRKKMNGMKFPKKAAEHHTGILSAEKIPKLEAMAFIHRVNEKMLRQQWFDAHRNEITERDFKRYKEIWPSIEAADGNFIGVDKYMISEMVRIIFKAKDKTFHIAFLDYLRAKLLTKDHNWPHSMKYFGWIFLIVWCAGCCVLAIVYGISFDVQYEVEESETYSKQGYDDDCWTMNPQLVIQDLLTKDWIDDSIHELNNNFGSEVGDSSSWLLQLLQSTLISLFIWQPLTVYFITWLMIWLFSWNLPVLLKPRIIYSLLQKICGCVAKNAALEERKKARRMELQMTEVIQNNKVQTKEDRYSVLDSRSHISRPNTPQPITPPPISIKLENHTSIKKKKAKHTKQKSIASETRRKQSTSTQLRDRSMRRSLPLSPTTPDTDYDFHEDDTYVAISRHKSVRVSVKAEDIDLVIRPKTPKTPETPETPGNIWYDTDDEDNYTGIQFKKGGTKMVETGDGEVAKAQEMFIEAVKRRISATPVEELDKYDNVFDIKYGTNRYQKIVSKEQRPFDVFSFFGGEIFFLDVEKSEKGTGLDVKVYGGDFNRDKALIIEDLELEAYKGRNEAVSWHKF